MFVPTQVAAPHAAVDPGWHSDINRAFRPPKVGLQLSQTTHVQNAFSPEMVAGSHLDAPRIFIAPTETSNWLASSARTMRASQRSTLG